jgi:hypothetical protein
MPPALIIVSRHSRVNQELYQFFPFDRGGGMEYSVTMGSSFWWGKNIFIAVFALFFLLFGIEALIGSFNLKNPMEFIMYFFSASFMVLVSLAGILYPAFQLHTFFKTRKTDNEPEK